MKSYQLGDIYFMMRNSQNQTDNSDQSGFTLIEVMVVVAIIGVLAAAGMVGYTSYLNGVKVDTHKNNAKALASGSCA
jgi:prepilin-type N-terminal cleavage/methylation domain-containing protein